MKVATLDSWIEGAGRWLSLILLGAIDDASETRGGVQLQTLAHCRDKNHSP
jgi:hypothetical protein